MYMKMCPECRGKSYSASKKGEWLCPECKRSLLHVNAVIAKYKDDNNNEEGK